MVGASDHNARRGVDLWLNFVALGTIPVPRVVSGRKRSTLCIRCKAHFPCRASPVGPWPRRTIHAILGWLPLLLRNIRVRVCYSSSQGRCCMGLTGPPIRATAKRLPPESLARSPYPTSPSLRRNEDARPAKFSGQSKVFEETSCLG